MSELSPEHTPGAANNLDETVQHQKTSNSPGKQPAGRNTKRSHKRSSGRRPKEDFSQTDSDSDLEPRHEPRRRKNFFTPNRGNDQGKFPLFSLPNQNLDASIHASCNNGRSLQVPIFGKLAASHLQFSPSPMTFPQRPQLPNTNFFSNGDTPFLGRSPVRQFPDPPLDQYLSDPDPSRESNTKNSIKKSKNKTTYAGMAKYTLGKPTFNVDEPSSSVHQSASPNALIYDISEFPVVPTNQIILSINLQMGKVIYGAKMKFTNNKRSHLELAFFSKKITKI